MKLVELTEARGVATPKEMEYYANADNWPTELEAARAFAEEAVNKWQWQEKAPKFLAAIARAPSVAKLQELVIYPLLSGEGLGVAK